MLVLDDLCSTYLWLPQVSEKVPKAKLEGDFVRVGFFAETLDNQGIVRVICLFLETVGEHRGITRFTR